MAEVAFVASVIQVADIGLRLSLRLYTFGETVASADQAILAISKDVSLTSSVLKELGNTFEGDKGRVHSKNAIETAETVVKECSKVFQEMDSMLLAKASNLYPVSTDRKSRAKSLLERLRWPTVKEKIQSLNCNLDRMKSTLTLMLNVIIYARQISEKTEAPHIIAEQQRLIEDLVHANEERNQMYDKTGVLERDYQLPHSTDETYLNLCQVSDYKKEAGNGRDKSSSLYVSPNWQRNSSQTQESSTDGLVRVIQEYTKLRENLIEEVCSTQYSIEEMSRARFRTQIDSAHALEVKLLLDSRPTERLGADVDSAEAPAAPKDDIKSGSKRSLWTGPQDYPERVKIKARLVSPYENSSTQKLARDINPPNLTEVGIRKLENSGYDNTSGMQTSSDKSREQVNNPQNLDEEAMELDATPIGNGVVGSITRNASSVLRALSPMGASPHTGYKNYCEISVDDRHPPYNPYQWQSFPPGSSTPGSNPVIIEQAKKPQCWAHGCNGRTFTTFSNLLRHQREKSGTSSKSVCPRCGAEFGRKTARDGHMAHDKCKSRSMSAELNLPSTGYTYKRFDAMRETDENTDTEDKTKEPEASGIDNLEAQLATQTPTKDNPSDPVGVNSGTLGPSSDSSFGYDSPYWKNFSLHGNASSEEPTLLDQPKYCVSNKTPDACRKRSEMLEMERRQDAPSEDTVTSLPDSLEAIVSAGSPIVAGLVAAWTIVKIA